MLKIRFLFNVREFKYTYVNIIKIAICCCIWDGFHACLGNPLRCAELSHTRNMNHLFYISPSHSLGTLLLCGLAFHSRSTMPIYILLMSIIYASAELSHICNRTRLAEWLLHSLQHSLYAYRLIYWLHLYILPVSAT